MNVKRECPLPTLQSSYGHENCENPGGGGMMVGGVPLYPSSLPQYPSRPPQRPQTEVGPAHHFAVNAPAAEHPPTP